MKRLFPVALFFSSCLVACTPPANIDPPDLAQVPCDNVEACLQLGEANQVNNRMAAFKAYEKACAMNSGEGCYRAAFALQWNFGKDDMTPQTAREFLRKSCRLHHHRACHDLIEIWKFMDC